VYNDAPVYNSDHWKIFDHVSKSNSITDEVEEILKSNSTQWEVYEGIDALVSHYAVAAWGLATSEIVYGQS
jgi:hypothetical protein